jgi:signal transduction histidine kinase
VALALATGNTLEALLGAWALDRVGFRRSLDRLRDVLALIGFAALASTLVSATMGVASLYLGGLVTVDRVADTWRAWWMGDVIGDLVVAPLLLTWASDRRLSRSPRRVLEAAALGISLLGGALGVFRWAAADERTAFGQVYALFPLLIWAAVRFGQRGAATTTFLISVVAIACTALGHGPFVHPPLSASLLSLQTFMSIVAPTFLILAATIAERRTAIEDLESGREALAEVNRELEQAVHARDSFISVASHELRTPLNALRLQVGLMRRRPETEPSASAGEWPQVLERQLLRLTRLVNSLLDGSRIAAGHLVLEPEDDVDLAAVVREVAEQFDTELRRGTCSLRLHADAQVLGRWDRLRLDAVVTNLLSNGIKYGDGKPIDIFVEDDVQTARLLVRDHGPGIAPEDQGRIFERFERGVSEREVGGLGLGLWIVRQFVEALGGRIRVESRVGEGSTFTVELPKRGPTPAASATGTSG